MYAFDDVAAVTAALERLASREEPLVAQLARQPGARESRWMHLLGESVEGAATVAAQERSGAAMGLSAESKLQERVAELESLMRALEDRVNALEGGTEKPDAP
jgi:hypothetical protein